MNGRLTDLTLSGDARADLQPIRAGSAVALSSRAALAVSPMAAARPAARRLLPALLWALLLAPAASSAQSTGLLEARSSDGRYLLRADNDRRELIAIDAERGEVIKRIVVADRRGVTSRVARVLDAPPRRSFIALLLDIPETWELSYDPNAEPVYDGLVHDFRMGEGIAERGPFAVRRIVLDEPLTEATFTPDFSQYTAPARDGSVHVVNLHVRRRIEIRRP